MHDPTLQRYRLALDPQIQAWGIEVVCVVAEPRPVRLSISA